MYLRLQSRARSRLGPMDAKRFASTWDTGKWVARVWLTSRQAVELFPKFGSWAVGMRCESEDGNTNLPISCSTEQIVEHLSVNVRFRARRVGNHPAVTRAHLARAVETLKAWHKRWLFLSGVRR